MTIPQLLTAQDVDSQTLAEFLRRVYPAAKAEFLIRHGAWWHGSDENRLVVLADGQIASYSAVIPARASINGTAHDGLWLVDVMTVPEFRGKGLQRQLDERLKEITDLLLGFPNELAAKVHRKHGWGVRQNLQVRLLPLQPLKVKSVLSSHHRHGLFLRLGALALAPLAFLWRAWLMLQHPKFAWRLPKLDTNRLADVFIRAPKSGLITTWRDTDYFDWRYGKAPNPSEYSYYLAGQSDAPSLYLIARHIQSPDGLRYTRILDVFGDFSNHDALRDLLTLAVQDAITHRSGQVTLVGGYPPLREATKKIGFLFSTPFYFCWWSKSADMMAIFDSQNYWTLADSDNDAPD